MRHEDDQNDSVYRSIHSVPYPCFPDSTLRGTAELGEYNQVAVALIIYLLGGKIPGLYAISLPPKVVTNNLTNSGPI